MLKTWWEGLSEDEQKMVKIGGSLLTVVVFYWLLWLPLAAGVAEKQQRLAKQISLNQWAQEAIAQIKAAGGKSSRTTTSLSQIVNNTTRQYNITVARMNPKADTLDLVIDDIAFNTLLNWLALLEQRQGIKIHNIDISNTDIPGMVRVGRLVIGKV